MADLMEDHDPVMKGPPFNPVVDLSKLSHGEFVARAKEVITPWNLEGHPPPGVLLPTMQNLIDGLEVTRDSYASVTNPIRKQSSPSESSYNGSVLTEDRESINYDKHQTVTGSTPLKTKEKTAAKNLLDLIAVAIEIMVIVVANRAAVEGSTGVDGPLFVVAGDGGRNKAVVGFTPLCSIRVNNPALDR